MEKTAWQKFKEWFAILWHKIAIAPHKAVDGGTDLIGNPMKAVRFVLLAVFAYDLLTKGSLGVSVFAIKLVTGIIEAAGTNLIQSGYFLVVLLAYLIWREFRPGKIQR